MKVVCDEAVLGADDVFRVAGVDDFYLLPAAQITPASIEGADALIVRSTVSVDANLLAKHTPRFLATATVGSDHVDLELLQDRLCHFVSAQGSSAASVAQFTWAMIALLVAQQDRRLTDLQLGVVGCGAIGERVARCGEAIGMVVRRVDPPLAETDPNGPYLQHSALSNCDVVSLHVPLTTSGPWPTFHMVNRDWLQSLPRGVMLVNTARGSLVVEEDLMACCESGHVGALALDVFPKEPEYPGILAQHCAWATPHIAGRSIEGMRANTEAIAREFYKFFDLETKQLLWPEMKTPPSLALSAQDQPADFIAKAWNLASLTEKLKSAGRQSAAIRASTFKELRRPPYRRDLTAFPTTGSLNDELRSFIVGLA